MAHSPFAEGAAPAAEPIPLGDVTETQITQRTIAYIDDTPGNDASPSLVPSLSSSQTSPTSSPHRARPTIVDMLTFIIDARRRSSAFHDTIIDAVIGRTVATRIMSFARQVAGGRVGCLREQWR